MNSFPNKILLATDGHRRRLFGGRQGDLGTGREYQRAGRGDGAPGAGLPQAAAGGSRGA